MTQTREILRLYEQAGLSRRKIAGLVGLSRPTVGKILDRLIALNLDFKTVSSMTDSELEKLTADHCESSVLEENNSRAGRLRLRFPDYVIELKKHGVTLRLLWEEYTEKEAIPLSYTQFCFHFQQWKEEDKVSRHTDYKAGDKMMVDYAGKKMHIIPPGSKKEVPVEVFVAILPCSGLTYVEASMSQDKESFMRVNERAIRYFGGVPSAIVPDNLKAGVLKADLYEPSLNPLYADFAEFYRTAILPARAAKPKDKPHVENMVRIIYTRVYAELRNETFTSVEELNKAIKEKLEDHNNRPMQKLELSRRELFEKVEKEALKSLPLSKYPLKHFQHNCPVQINYHVFLKEDKHYYSVPYRLKKKRVKIIYDDKIVAIYYDNERVVQHMRDRNIGKYTTLASHMPKHHRFDEDWHPEKLKWWAGNVGEDTKRVIEHVLDSKPHPEQAYKACLGILSLAPKYGQENLNYACRKAWNMEQVYYRFIKEQAVFIHTQQEREMDEKQLSLIPDDHENIRGQGYYS